MIAATIALACAAVIGYAAHRASLCNVRAVGEVLTTGKAQLLWVLAQGTLWAAMLSGVLVLVFRLTPQPTLAHLNLVWAAAGGALFGLGAAINGGCSLSTVHRLVDGDVRMLATLAGLVGGAFASSAAQVRLGSVPYVALESPWLRWPDIATVVLLLLVAWAIWRTATMLRVESQRDYSTPVARILWPNHEASVIAAAMGLAAGALYAIEGAWTYSNFIRTAVHGTSSGTPVGLFHGALVAALLSGMLLSGLQRRSFNLQVPTLASMYLRHGTAGLLMGLGASLIPGGNDTLLLSSLPALTVSAAVAYASMLAGIALGLLALQGKHIRRTGNSVSASRSASPPARARDCSQAGQALPRHRA